MAEMPKEVVLRARIVQDPVSVPVAKMGDHFEIPIEVPTYAHVTDAGADLVAREEAYIRAGQRMTVGTGVIMAIPEGFVGLIWPRSGLAVRHGISVLAGVIDSGYRGEVRVALLNTDPFDDVHLEAGDRIAQILIQPVVRAEFMMVPIPALENSDRGQAGFGSTGV